MKSWGQALKGTISVPTVAYLRDAVVGKAPKWEPNISGIIKALQCVAAKYVNLNMFFFFQNSNLVHVFV